MLLRIMTMSLLFKINSEREGVSGWIDDGEWWGLNESTISMKKRQPCVSDKLVCHVNNG